MALNNTEDAPKYSVHLRREGMFWHWELFDGDRSTRRFGFTLFRFNAIREARFACATKNYRTEIISLCE